jgi:hypothetical protein
VSTKGKLGAELAVGTLCDRPDKPATLAQEDPEERWLPRTPQLSAAFSGIWSGRGDMRRAIRVCVR